MRFIHIRDKINVKVGFGESTFPTLMKWIVFAAFGLAVAFVGVREIRGRKPEPRILLLSSVSPEKDAFWIDAVTRAGGQFRILPVLCLKSCLDTRDFRSIPW